MNTGVFSSEQLLKYLFTTSALGTRPTAWYVALHTGAPSLDGSDNEAAYSGYVRQSVAFTATQPGGTDTPWQVDNDADVAFPATNASVTVTHVTVFDAASAGNCLAVFELPISRTVASGGVFSIPAGELVITGD